MERHQSEQRRYSFHTSPSKPAAESTIVSHLDTDRSCLDSSFKWGSSPLSPKRRSNSSTGTLRVAGVYKADATRCRSPRKIDPRIVADVQSKGLASRIVKYHENGSCLNRSMSASNLYSKPGQFPIVTLNKTELPYRATKQNVSMTRIAPPEKSAFYGNTLSSLLRSNSVLCLQKSEEDISRENRPILHPPPSENDLAPTRSVLDVLKEISRKRIISDDPLMPETKKNKVGNDYTDTPPPLNISLSHKRQRDINSPNKDQNCLIRQDDSKLSPEQAKKRLCNYNNDISSSLSSSAKRKDGVSKRPQLALNQTLPTRLDLYETTIGQGYKTAAARSISQVEHPTPTEIESQTCGIDVGIASANTEVYGTTPGRSKSEPATIETARTEPPSSKPRLTLFNKAYDNSEECVHNASAVEELEAEDRGECAGIQFVKPKKLASACSKNPVIERAQKSKLALMLSGLRGELYHGTDNDELDSRQQPIREQTTSDNVSSDSQASAVSQKIPQPTQLPQPALNKIGNAVSTPNSQNKTASLVGLKLTPANSTPETFKVSSAQMSGPAQPSIMPSLPTVSKGPSGNTASQSVVTTSLSVTNAVSEKPQASADLSSAGNVDPSKSAATPLATKAFSFGLSKGIAFASQNEATKTTAPAIDTTAFAAKGSPATVFDTTKSQSFALGQINKPSTSSPNQMFSASTSVPVAFGTTPDKTSEPNTTASILKPAGGFSFSVGASTTATTFGSEASTVSVSGQPAKPQFSFGSGDSTNATTASVTAQPGKVQLNFGSSETSNARTANVTAQPPKAQFNFGSGETTKATTVSVTAQPANALFSFGSAETTKATTASATAQPAKTQFSFGSGDTANAPTQPAKAHFSFGSGDATNTTTASATTQPGKTQFSFGSGTSTNDTPAPAFAKTFSFGSALNSSSTSTTKPLAALAPTAASSVSTPDMKTSIFGAKTSVSSSSIFNVTNSSQPVFGTTATISTSGPFSGGGSTELNPTSISSVGNSNSQTQSRFGASDGSKVAAPNYADSKGQNFVANSTPAPSGGFSLGGAKGPSFSFGAASPSSTTAAVSSTFSFASNTESVEKKNQTFGGPAPGGNGSTTAAPVFSFGSALSAPSSQKTTPAFAFNAGPALKPPVNGAPASGGFSFNAVAQAGASVPSAVKPFSFGAPNSSQATEHSNNLFASKPAPPTFNFAAALTSNNQSPTMAVPPGGNMFAAAAGLGNGPADRPKRRATRRLQK